VRDEVKNSSDFALKIWKRKGFVWTLAMVDTFDKVIDFLKIEK
jgi:hypothetical protein